MQAKKAPSAIAEGAFCLADTLTRMVLLNGKRFAPEINDYLGSLPFCIICLKALSRHRLQVEGIDKQAWVVNFVQH